MTELEQEIQELVSPHFIVKSIDSVNHDPHPFMIGARHVAHAADYHGGSLDEDALNSAEAKGIFCAHRGCNLTYKAHTSDKVCFIQLTNHLSSKLAQETLLKTEQVFKREGIDGVCLVETEEQYRINE